MDKESARGIANVDQPPAGFYISNIMKSNVEMASLSRDDSRLQRSMASIGSTQMYTLYEGGASTSSFLNSFSTVADTVFVRVPEVLVMRVVTFVDGCTAALRLHIMRLMLLVSLLTWESVDICGLTLQLLDKWGFGTEFVHRQTNTPTARLLMYLCTQLADCVNRVGTLYGLSLILRRKAVGGVSAGKTISISQKQLRFFLFWAFVWISELSIGFLLYESPPLNIYEGRENIQTTRTSLKNWTGLATVLALLRAAGAYAHKALVVFWIVNFLVDVVFALDSVEQLATEISHLNPDSWLSEVGAKCQACMVEAADFSQHALIWLLREPYHIFMAIRHMQNVLYDPRYKDSSIGDMISLDLFSGTGKNHLDLNELRLSWTTQRHIEVTALETYLRQMNNGQGPGFKMGNIVVSKGRFFLTIASLSGIFAPAMKLWEVMKKAKLWKWFDKTKPFVGTCLSGKEELKWVEPKCRDFYQGLLHTCCVFYLSAASTEIRDHCEQVAWAGFSNDACTCKSALKDAYTRRIGLTRTGKPNILWHALFNWTHAREPLVESEPVVFWTGLSFRKNTRRILDQVTSSVGGLDMEATQFPFGRLLRSPSLNWSRDCHDTNNDSYFYVALSQIYGRWATLTSNRTVYIIVNKSPGGTLGLEYSYLYKYEAPRIGDAASHFLEERKMYNIVVLDFKNKCGTPIEFLMDRIHAALMQTGAGDLFNCTGCAASKQYSIRFGCVCPECNASNALLSQVDVTKDWKVIFNAGYLAMRRVVEGDMTNLLAAED